MSTTGQISFTVSAGLVTGPVVTGTVPNGSYTVFLYEDGATWREAVETPWGTAESALPPLRHLANVGRIVFSIVNGAFNGGTASGTVQNGVYTIHMNQATGGAVDLYMKVPNGDVVEAAGLQVD